MAAAEFQELANPRADRVGRDRGIHKRQNCRRFSHERGAWAVRQVRSQKVIDNLTVREFFGLATSTRGVLPVFECGETRINVSTAGGGIDLPSHASQTVREI